MIDLGKLKLLATNATQGPWWNGVCNPADGHALAWIGTHFVETEHRIPYNSQEDDAAYIAAANPAVILELIDRIEQLEAKQAMEGWQLVPVEPTQEMIDAAHNAGFGVPAEWKSMLAAAPKPDCAGVHHSKQDNQP